MGAVSVGHVREGGPTEMHWCVVTGHSHANSQHTAAPVLLLECRK